MPPSFNRLLDHTIATRPHDHPVWAWNAKLDGRQLAGRADVRTPTLLQVAPLGQMARPTVTVAVKPNRGCAGHGVWLLKPYDGRYLSLFDGNHVTWDEVLADCAAWEGVEHANPHETVTGPWLVEEAVHPDRPPIDWKAYCIGGRVWLWRQMVRRIVDGHLVKYGRDWNRNFQPVTATTRPRVILDPTLPPPHRPGKLTAAAERVARLVPGPFIRVDLYEDDRGPLFGEITPNPADGRIRFNRTWDRKMGRAWKAAQ